MPSLLPSDTPMLRTARALAIAHVVIVLFATVALVTIVLAPEPPSLMNSPYAGVVYEYAMKFSGPSYVVLGALAALLHAMGRLGTARAWLMLAVAFVISLGAELLGTGTGLPFGEYAYTTLLGYRIGGRVPYPIPLSWFYMLYGCLAICARIMHARDDWGTRAKWAVVAGLFLVAWDISLDPAMSYSTKHWIWLQEGAFYGMPWINLAGWMLTGTVVAFAMLAIAPPTLLARQLAPTRLPLALYAVNGIMPLAMVARTELWWSLILGTIAMAIPLVLAWRATRREVALADAPTVGSLRTVGSGD